MQLLSKLKEELKSQPLVSPVPTPTSSTSIKREEATIVSAKLSTDPIVKLEKQLSSPQKIEIADIETQHKQDIIEIKYETKETKKFVDEILDLKPKHELEVKNITSDVSPRSETSGGSTKTQLETPLFRQQESDKKSDTETMRTGSEERRSSESEPDSDAVPIPQGYDNENDHERKGFFHQPESLEDELPYVPTTLPQERPVAHPMVPVKQRMAEVRTCPIERPRSTTPIHPATLDDYVSSPLSGDDTTTTAEKMQIVLPRTESFREGRSKSPHRPAVKPWTHFAEQGLQSPRELRRVASPSPPPPLPPRSTPAPAPTPATASWVCFDEVPERRRTPKRITTLPSASGTVVYNYVNPEECSCECHEVQGRTNGTHSGAHCQYKDQYRT